MLHKDYDRKGCLEKTLVVILKGPDSKMNWFAYTTSRKVTLTSTLT
jgi:hypothetical protein